MHRGCKLPEDTPLTLDYFKHGSQEYEANEFATELLMPEHEFRSFVQDRAFSPDLLREIAAYFNTSITSSAFRYLQIGPHPLFLFYSRNRYLVYWKNSPNYYLTVKDIIRLPVPDDSVAMEFYAHQTIYSQEESAQEIVKSTWFETRGYDDNAPFYEYAIVTKNYNTVLSVVWED
ncbi:MAG TPA: ImmA/IrrE family metallo-endopeptidase [Dysgonamonadaceae bacterium]|nr:ImmA/IrrE family metallo-endopeptidase [Dysgonamonadaceae bacterium]